MECSFCKREISINTTIGEFFLKLSLDDEYGNILKIRVEQGSVGRTRPIKINYCFMCGKDLLEESFNGKPLTASAMGKIGGSNKSPAKASASRTNGKLGGRPKKAE